MDADKVARSVRNRSQIPCLASTNSLIDELNWFWFLSFATIWFKFQHIYIYNIKPSKKSTTWVKIGTACCLCPLEASPIIRLYCCCYRVEAEVEAEAELRVVSSRHTGCRLYSDDEQSEKNKTVVYMQMKLPKMWRRMTLHLGPAKNKRNTWI